MRRHVWATERLWEGLYMPSDENWKRGTDALTGDPFPKEVVDRGGVHGRSAAEQFRKLAVSAGTRRTSQEKAQLYGALLGTCSACHVVTRERP